MSKRYTLLDANDFVMHTEIFTEGNQPNNAIQVLPTVNYLKPKYDRQNNAIIEGATQSEIDQADRVLKHTKRDELLKIGIVVVSNDVNFWFNKTTLSDFMVMKNELKNVQQPAMQWKDEKGDWKVIPMDEADVISITGMTMIQQIYIDN